MDFNGTLLSKTIIATFSIFLINANAQAVDGHFGLDLSLSNETGNIGVYSMREKENEIMNIGAEFFFNEPGDKFVDINASVSRKGMGNENLEAGVKGKIYYVEQKNDGVSGQGLLLGVTARYWLPTEVPVSLAVDALYNPPIVAFGDVKSAFNIETKLELRILPSATAYIGFRSLVVDFNQRSNHELDKNINVGINLAL